MLDVNIVGARDLAGQIDVLKIPPLKRRTLLRSMGREVRRNSRKRVTRQQTLDGGNMAPRSERSGKKGKMLKGLGKRMLVATDSDSVTVKFRSGKAAYQQQHGVTELFDPDKMARRDKKKPQHEDKKDRPASRKQARRLLRLGYKIRRGQKGWKRPTIKWITNHIKVGQAGLLIRILSEEEAKKSWEATLPARPFLGATDQEVNQLGNRLADAVMKLG